MPATTIKRDSVTEHLKTTFKTNHSGRFIVEKYNLPLAGSGACTHCSCQKFVKRDVMQKPYPVTGNQPNPCDNCGHDFRVHS